MAPKDGRSREYKCEDCCDTGMFSVWCDRHQGSSATRKPWMTVAQPCSLEKCLDHVLYPHEWVTRCACWDTNPSLIRKRAAQAEYADQRTEQRRAS